MPVDLNEEHVLLYDSNGVEMAVSNGVAAPVGTRGYVQAGSDGTNIRFRLLDTSGRSLTVGAAAAGAAPVGNPLLVSGSDGAAVRTLRTGTDGSLLSRLTDGTNTVAVKAAGAAALVGDPSLVVAISPNVNPLVDPRLLGADRGIFGTGVTGDRLCLMWADFSRSLANNDVSSTASGGATVTQANGMATLTSTAAATASAKINTNQSPKYSPGREIYAQFTAVFTTPTSVNSHQRAGLYSSTGSPQNGFFIGYQGTTFGVTVRRAGVDTFTARASWDGDPLDGSATSQFTRGGTPEAIDFTKYNVYRIRYGWLGAAIIRFEAMSPDGLWVIFHTIRQPNSVSVPSLTSPSAPFTMEVIKASADATNLVMASSSWDIGTVESALGYRQEDIKSNKHVTANVAAQTANATVYTVSSGRDLLVTTIILLAANTATLNGRLDLKDGGAGGTTIIPFTFSGSTNQSNAGAILCMTFPTPLRFATDVFANVIAGTLTYSITIVGYEVAE